MVIEGGTPLPPLSPKSGDGWGTRQSPPQTANSGCRVATWDQPSSEVPQRSDFLISMLGMAGGQRLRQFVWSVDQDVGMSALQRLWREPISHADAPQVGIARSQDVDLRVAYHDGLMGFGTGLLHQGLGSQSIGLLGFEAVAAVGLEEELRQPQSSKNVAGGAHRFVGQDRHLSRMSVEGRDPLERLADALIGAGVIQFVVAVVQKEEI